MGEEGEGSQHDEFAKLKRILQHRGLHDEEEEGHAQQQQKTT